MPAAVLLAIGAAGLGCRSQAPVLDASEPPHQPRWPAASFASTNLASLDQYPRDGAGVIQVDYGTRYENAGVQYNPQLVARYAQMLYAKMLETENPDELRELWRGFQAQVTWLLNNGKEVGDAIVWTYDFPNPYFDAPSGWTSGMAQGFVLSALIEAHSLTGDERYLEVASKALTAFEIPLPDGGVRTELSGSGAWYEEVAGPDVPSSKILNGHIFALSGIRDYYMYTGEDRARVLFDEGVAATEDLLVHFDGDDISFYALTDQPAPCHYHRLHVRQLTWLYEVTGRPAFKEYADRFDGYDGPDDICA